jgi:hypothetical protein
MSVFFTILKLHGKVMSVKFIEFNALAPERKPWCRKQYTRQIHTMKMLRIPENCRPSGYSPETWSHTLILQIGSIGLIVASSADRNCSIIRIQERTSGTYRWNVITCGGCMNGIGVKNTPEWIGQLERELGFKIFGGDGSAATKSKLVQALKDLGSESLGKFMTDQQYQSLPDNTGTDTGVLLVNEPVPEASASEGRR